MTDWLLQGSRQVALLLEQAGTRGQVPVTSWTLLGALCGALEWKPRFFFFQILAFYQPALLPWVIAPAPQSCSSPPLPHKKAVVKCRRDISRGRHSKRIPERALSA